MTATASPQEWLAAGEPVLALQALQDQVRDRPGDPQLRIFLFQLLCVLGQWQRAATQLDLCGQLDPAALAMVSTYRAALECEALRGAVFAGKHTPLVFGQPAPWVAMLVEALAQDAQGQAEPARRLRRQALDAAPASAGTLNGEPFEWICDADSRLGPLLEVVLNGRYTWMPFACLSALHAEPPADLRDMVWTPVRLTFTNGGESVALVPTCYPGTREQADKACLLARATVWLELGDEQFAGFGQRLLSTSQAELGLLDVRDLRFTPAPAA